MKFKYFCETYLDIVGWETLQRKKKKFPTDWSDIKSTEVVLEYRTSEMPMARKGAYQCDATLSKNQIGWIWSEYDESGAHANQPGNIFRCLKLYCLPGGNDFIKGAKNHLRTILVCDEIIDNHGMTHKVGDSGSVVVGPGREMLFFELLAMFKGTLPDSGMMHILIRRSSDRVRGIPTDLICFRHPGLTVRFVADDEALGEHCDWALGIEVPRLDAGGGATARKAAIYHSRFCADFRAAGPFARLPSVPLPNTPRSHLVQYLAHGPLARLSDPVPRNSALLLSLCRMDPQDAPGCRTRLSNGGGPAVSAGSLLQLPES